MTRTYVNLDANESIFLNKQLESVKAQTYDRQYPELLARSLIPVSTSVSKGARTITYYSLNRVGYAKIIANYSTDIPRVDLLSTEHTGKVKSMGVGYSFTLEDVRAAQDAGIPLDARKSNAAKQAMLNLEDDIALVGDADHGLHGLLTHPNVPDVAIPADGTGSSSLWSSKDADLIMRDINLLISQIVTTTKGAEKPNTLLLATGPFVRASSLRVGESGQTVIEFFKRTNPWIKDIIPWAKLTGAGAGGTDVMIAYDRNPDKLSLEVPQDFEQMPVQEVGFEYITNCHARTGGVLIYSPLSLAKADGI